MAQATISDFTITEELHKTIIQSLVSSFGLDFLLFEDKKGGDVDTIHNVRAYHNGETDINISDKTKSDLNNNLKYSAKDNNGNKIFRYHEHDNYKKRGKSDKELHNQGLLHDDYRNDNMKANEKSQLDHKISAHEIHTDGGRNTCWA